MALTLWSRTYTMVRTSELGPLRELCAVGRSVEVTNAIVETEAPVTVVRMAAESKDMKLVRYPEV